MSDLPLEDIPLKHVLRPSLPWREGEALTECKLPADKYPTMTRDELRSMAKKMGRQRTTVLTCNTCLNTAQRWPSWDEDPIACLDRETSKYNGSERFRNELMAIVALIEAHRDEFRETLASLGGVVNLQDVRDAKRKGSR